MEPIDKLKRSLRHYWHDDSSSYLVSREDMDQVDSILDSLLPENSKTFTLAEVEAIAREAVENCYVGNRCGFSIATFDPDWWDRYSKELIK